jgi:hypothetical protein
VVVSLVNEAQALHQALELPDLFGVVTDRPDMAIQGRVIRHQMK